MKRPDTSSARPNHRAPMQMMTFVTSLGMLLIAEASLPDVGLAQSYRPLPQTDAPDGSLPRLDPMGPQGRMQHRWDIVSRACRTCRRACCEKKAAKAVSTRIRSWIRSWRFAKAADLAAALRVFAAAAAGRRGWLLVTFHRSPVCVARRWRGG